MLSAQKLLGCKLFTPGSGSCRRCSAGSFAPGTGNTECVLCPAGQYSESDAADKCVDCQAGTAAEVAG